MKEDILEQLVDGYFLRKPSTFTKHNVKYRPKVEDIKELNVKDRSQYSVASDIDVMAVHWDKFGVEQVSVVSCKSWQSGFDLDFFYRNLSGLGDKNKRVGTGEAWKKFRELTEEKWAKAFREKILEETKSKSFTYYIAITKFKGTENQQILNDFENCELFIKNLSGDGEFDVRIKFLTLEKIMMSIFSQGLNTSIEATKIGRFMQLIKAAGLDLVNTKRKKI
jgi:hypothetical protein